MQLDMTTGEQLLAGLSAEFFQERVNVVISCTNEASNGELRSELVAGTCIASRSVSDQAGARTSSAEAARVKM